MSGHNATGPTQMPHRRLILNMGPGVADAETLRAAAEFARLLGLDLHGLFIEDEALLALAVLPFAREIRWPTHEWNPIDAETLMVELRQAAAQMQRSLEEIIHSVGVPGTFEVLRGDPAACIAAVCHTGDIVMISEYTSPAARSVHGIMQLQAAVHGSAASVLLLPAGCKPRRGPVVAVLVDVMDLSLDVACRTAIAAGEGLTLLLLETSGQSGQRAGADRAKARAHALGLPNERIIVHAVRGIQVEDVLHALTRLHESLIVMTRATVAACDTAGASRVAAVRRVPVLLLEVEPHTALPH